MRWTDGSVYVGQWERGIQHGYGKITFPDGTSKEGYFQNNVYVGPTKHSEKVRLTSTKRKRKGAEKLLLSPSSLAGPKFGGANAFYQNKAQYNRSSSRLVQLQ